MNSVHGRRQHLRVLGGHAYNVLRRLVQKQSLGVGNRNLTRAQLTTDTAGISSRVTAPLLDRRLLREGGYIGAEWVTEGETGTFQVSSPATAEVLAVLPSFAAQGTQSAVAAADSVQQEWGHASAYERAGVLKRWHRSILDAADDLALIMTLESGKPLAEAQAEVAAGAACVEWFAEEAKRICGDVLQPRSAHEKLLVLKQPVGVVACITPWNFPMAMITRKVAPALAAGCSVVLKPAELTPLSAIALVELAQRAQLPQGVLNLVFGDAARIGREMCASPLVRKLTFTGSTAVGKLLLAQAAPTVKRVSMELGGNAPFLVFDDADLDAAAAHVVLSGLRNAGQTCICTNRVFVQERAYDAFAAKVAAAVRKLKVGNGLEASTTIGPLIDERARSRVEGHVNDATHLGAQVLEGGRRPDLPEPLQTGYFYQPTVLRDASINMRLFREETFGPLIPLFSFKQPEEAVQLANDTEYGLAAYIHTKDMRLASRVAQQLEYGMVGVNEVKLTHEVAPFGGIKQSGLGREMSKYGLDEYLELKYLCMNMAG